MVRAKGSRSHIEIKLYLYVFTYKKLIIGLLKFLRNKSKFQKISTLLFYFLHIFHERSQFIGIGTIGSYYRSLVAFVAFQGI